MKGVYSGLQSYLKKNTNPSCIYTHCLGLVPIKFINGMFIWILWKFWIFHLFSQQSATFSFVVDKHIGVNTFANNSTELSRLLIWDVTHV
jgi:hypothetical protein